MIHTKLTPTILLRTFFTVFLAGALSTGLYAQGNEEIMTNRTIIQLYRAGISKSVIAAKINNSQCNFDLSTNGLVDLKDNGIPDDIVTTMVNRASAAPAADQQQNTAPGGEAVQDDAGLQAQQAPPELPAYEQPPCPVDGYLWQPGYWAFNLLHGFYWVPGVWVAPPNPGLLWTPCYWGYDGGVYVFHRGYWGERVGFYGGINYGYGYVGVGFVGGGWHEGHFRYNTAVVHVNETVVHNTYVDRTVIRNTTVVNNRTSFNGQGGVTAKPRPEELAAMKQPHVQPTPEQLSHQQAAASDKNQFARENGGHPTQTAVATPNKAPANMNNGRNLSANPNNNANGNRNPNGNGNPNGQPNGNRNPNGNGNPNGQPNGNRNPNANSNPNGQFNGNRNPNGQPNGNKPGNNGSGQQRQQERQQQRQQQPKNDNGGDRKNKKG